MTLNSPRRVVPFFVVVIANVGITGSIPSEFGLLSSKLEEMYLYDLPGLGGTIPTELGNLRLDYLWLNNNALTGPVPAFDFTYLIHLHLDNNMLTGTIAQCGSAEVKADCGGISPEVTCECCSICLVDSTDVPSMTPTTSVPPTIIAQLDILKEIYDSTGGPTHWRANNWFQPGVHFCDFDRIKYCIEIGFWEKV